MWSVERRRKLICKTQTILLGKIASRLIEDNDSGAQLAQSLFLLRSVARRAELEQRYRLQQFKALSVDFMRHSGCFLDKSSVLLRRQIHLTAKLNRFVSR